MPKNMLTWTSNSLKKCQLDPKFEQIRIDLTVISGIKIKPLLFFKFEGLKSRKKHKFLCNSLLFSTNSQLWSLISLKISILALLSKLILIQLIIMYNFQRKKTKYNLKFSNKQPSKYAKNVFFPLLFFYNEYEYFQEKNFFFHFVYLS